MKRKEVDVSKELFAYQNSHLDPKNHQPKKKDSFADNVSEAFRGYVEKDIEISKLKADLEGAKKVIEFYADRKNSYGTELVPTFIYEKPAGNRAREWLAERKKK